MPSDLPRAGFFIEEKDMFDKERKYTKDEIRKMSGNLVMLPGLCDVHVHFREPGFGYKETIASGSAAAAAGGYTAVCTMPNLSPVPDSMEHLKEQLDIIEKNAVTGVYPYGAITVGEKGVTLADMEEMSDSVIAFSDDGKGVQSEEMMRQAMIKAKALGKVIAAHCEDERYPTQDKRSEWLEIERDIRLAQETGCAFHVCHISCRESVQLIKEAKKKGIDITCETAPHYLVLDESMIKREGRFKMNPPIRTADDRAALLEGIKDGTIDMIATDHAPHSAEEKSRGFDSLFGIVGLETAFPVLYTNLVCTHEISLERLMELMAYNPAKRFGIDITEDFGLWDLESEYTIDSESFLSMGKATPFEGYAVKGKCRALFRKGRPVYEEE